MMNTVIVLKPKNVNDYHIITAIVGNVDLYLIPSLNI